MEVMHKECTKDIESETCIWCASDCRAYTYVQRAGFVVMEWQREINEAESTGNQLLAAWMQLKLSLGVLNGNTTRRVLGGVS